MKPKLLTLQDSLDNLLKHGRNSYAKDHPIQELIKQHNSKGFSPNPLTKNELIQEFGRQWTQLAGYICDNCGEHADEVVELGDQLTEGNRYYADTTNVKLCCACVTSAALLFNAIDK